MFLVTQRWSLFSYLIYNLHNNSLPTNFYIFAFVRHICLYLSRDTLKLICQSKLLQNSQTWLVITSLIWALIGQCTRYACNWTVKGTVNTSYLCKWRERVMRARCYLAFRWVNWMKTYNRCLVSFSNFVIVLIIGDRTSCRPILSVLHSVLLPLLMKHIILRLPQLRSIRRNAIPTNTHTIFIFTTQSCIVGRKLYQL